MCPSQPLPKTNSEKPLNNHKQGRYISVVSHDISNVANVLQCDVNTHTVLFSYQDETVLLDLRMLLFVYEAIWFTLKTSSKYYIKTYVVFYIRVWYALETHL